MPTNRTRKARSRRNADMPEWARTMLETGTVPEKADDSPEWSGFVGWFYFGEKVPGLADPDKFRRDGETITRRI